MTLVKICGITREEDARVCAAEGADFIGLVFAPSSPRAVTEGQAQRIVAALPARRPGIVGVFRNAPAAEVRRIVERVPLDLVQLHGSEPEGDIESAGAPVIRAIAVRGERPDFATSPAAAWLLFDTFDAVRGGGTGRVFDWSLLAAAERSRRFFLAGGLTPQNVGDAIRIARPDAVDVSTGVESAPGIKDPARVRALLQRARG